MPQCLPQVQKQIMQLIGQYLEDVGCSKTVEALISETDISIESSEARQLRLHIRNGQWSQAIECLFRMRGSLAQGERANEDLEVMSWLIHEEEIKELGRSGKVGDAIILLRRFNKNQVPDLHTRLKQVVWNLVSHPTVHSSHYADTLFAGRQRLLLELQKFFSPEVMLPPCRLQTLLSQAVAHQKSQCLFHVGQLDTAAQLAAGETTRIGRVDCESLMVDHCCDKSDFPTFITQRIKQHTNEVWFCKFSQSGKMLASSSKDGSVIIWDVDTATHQLSLQRTFLTNRTTKIAHIAWSPDETMILCTGTDTCNEAFVWNVTTGDLTKLFTRGSEDRFMSGSWYKDSRRFAVGGISGKFFAYNVDTEETVEWEGVRTQALHVLSDDTVLVADNLKRIRGFRFDNMRSHEVLTEDSSIITFTVSRTEEFILINVAGQANTQGIHLWDLHSKTLIGRYRGIIQGSYLHHSTFGGLRSQFIASGAENGTLSIWRRTTDDPMCVLHGHTSGVNCVTWNPVVNTMIVSAGDDGTIVCWAPKRYGLDPQPRVGDEIERYRATQISSPPVVEATE